MDINGFDYLLQRLEIQSPVGRERLFRQKAFAPDEEGALYVELERVERVKRYLLEGDAGAVVSKLRLKFSQVWDIRNTFCMVEKGAVDDVQLFEIKRFAFLVREISALWDMLTKACAFHPAAERFPDLGGVIGLLDPRNENLPTFHIYNEYSPLLAEKRKALTALLSDVAEDADASALQGECEALEAEIRARLCADLRPFLGDLRAAMERVAYGDVLVAKAALAVAYGLEMPERAGGLCPTGGGLVFEGLFNPVVKEILEKEGHRYQAVDVRLNEETCLLTGANMSGKTVLLKTLALAQTLFQWGFLVPARVARMRLYDGVELVVSDEQDEQRGLSSFGAEIMRLNRILDRLKQGQNLLLLIDEPARTTNPAEGKALVCALLERLKGFRCTALLSTHYGLDAEVRRLRVHGFREEWAPEGEFGLTRIQSCMDYAVEEEKPGEQPPAEALRIAALLGFDAEVLRKAETIFNSK